MVQIIIIYFETVFNSRMANINKDEILINFQAITGLEDLATCLEILEQKGWDMASAVNSMMPQPDYPSSTVDAPLSSGVRPADGFGPTSDGYVDLTSYSYQVTGQERTHPYIDVESYQDDQTSLAADGVALEGPLCELKVYYGTRTITVFVPHSSTVIQVKEQLKLKTGLLPSDQVLMGWPTGIPASDEVCLESLGLNSGVSYHLSLQASPRSFQAPSTSQIPSSYHDLPPSYAQATSNSPSLHDVIQSFSMPVVVGEQVTSRVVPTTPLAPVDLSRGSEEQLVAARVESPLEVSSPSSSSHYSDAAETISSDDNEPVLESFDDAMFDDGSNDVVAKAMKEPLIPRGGLEPYEALQFFTHAFEARYGYMHPLFLIGTLSDAVSEATSGSATSGTRKPMFVYLHHDASVLSNIFCSQLLCSESIVNYLTSNFITWAWDLTLHESRIKLLQMVEESFGKVAKSSVDEIRADHLPAILIVYKVKGTTDIKNIIQGETNLESLMASLMSAVDDHNLNIEREAMEEQERLMREHMIAEQNRAYQESLVADREKARQREEEELVRVEKQRLVEKERTDREEQREAMEVCVPDEPPADCGEKMCTLRIRYPDGSQATRRFLAVHRLQDLFLFLGSKGYLSDDYRILTGFPRKDISERNPSDTFEDCSLCPQETLFVEER